MRTKQMNRRLCFWNFASLLHAWGNRPGRHRRALQATGGLRRLSRLAPNFPYRRGLLALSLILPATALAGPAGEQVTAGIATITRPNTVTTLINQQTAKTVIDWQNFSIAQMEMVLFQQPGTDSIALNRVLGNDPSQIFGSLTANGQVFLVNPNGVLFAPGSQVSVHGLLATTHGISNDDFMAGRYTFAPGANPYTGAEVVNQGNLVAGENGYIVLAGDYAANTGVISAHLGRVTLASGNRFTLDLEGDELIGLAVDEASLAARAGVENFGTLAADGGQVVMTTKVAGELAGTVVNNVGLVQARSIGEQNGEIILYGGTSGIVANSGTLDASGRNAGETGGKVLMLGEEVGLFAQATVDVSGANGGGTALIGGDYQGRPMQLPLPFDGATAPLPNAKSTYLGKDTLIRADATETGDGGRVIAWADGVTRAYGTISAQGGATGGDGGFVEVSGKGYLDFQGKVDTRAPLGQNGTLLLDPTNITIQAASPDIDGALSGATDDITAATDLDSAAGDFSGADSVITGAALAGLLSSTGVTLAATNNITVNAAVGWTTASPLTLTAGNGISINNDLITTGLGDLYLTAGSSGITQGGGTIIADILTLDASGPISINQTGNNFNSLAATLTGGVGSTLSLKKSITGPLAINSLSSTGAVTIDMAGALTQNGAISTPSFTASTAGFINLNRTDNTVGTINLSQTSTTGAEIVFNNSAGTLNITGLTNSYTGGGSLGDIIVNATGSINLNGDVQTADTDGLIALSTQTADSILRTSGTITGNLIQLQNAVGSTGGVGASGNPLLTSSIGGSGIASVQIGTAAIAVGGAYLSHTGDLSLNDLSRFAANTPVSLTASGDLTFPVMTINTGTANLDLGAGDLLTVPDGTTLTSTANVSLKTNRLAIGSTSGEIGTAGVTPGLVWISPYTATTWGVDLGSAVDNTANTLEISSAELDRITTDVLRIGGTAAGNLNVSAAIAPSGTSTLSLESGGTITQAGAGTINETNLAIKALGNVTLDTAANLVTNLAASIGDGSNQNKNFKFKNTPALNIGSSIDSISGISIARDANDFASASPNGVIALTSSAGLTQSAGALLTGKAVYAEGSTVVLTEANSTGVIAGKATGSSAGDLFNYKSSSGISVTTVNSFAGIQSASTEPIGIQLTASNAGISQDADAPISAGTGLMLNTTGPVDLNATTNSVGALATTVGVSQLLFNDTNTLTLGISGNGISTTGNGAININAGGLLTVQDPIAAGTGVVSLEAPNIQLGIAAGTTIDGGVIKLRANDAANGTISSAGGISTVTSGSGLELEADNMNFSVFAPVFVATNEIAYTTFSDNRPITFGAGVCHGGGVNCLTINGATNTAPDLVIGNDTVADSNTAGDISIDGALAHAAGRVALLTGGGIDQTAAISATSLGFISGTVTNSAGVTLTQANSITNIAGETQGGAVSLTNTPALNIVLMSGGNPLYSDVRTVTGISTNDGDVSISNTGNITLPAHIDAGTGTVSLISSGSLYGSVLSPDVIAGVLTVTAPDGIDGAAGFHTQVPRIASLSATNGLINLLSFSGVTLGPATADNGATAVQAGGEITINAQSYPLTINGKIQGSNGIDLDAGSISQNADIATTASVDPGVSAYAATGNIVMDPSIVTSTNGAYISYSAPNGTVTYIATNFSGATPSITQYVAPEPEPTPTLDACTADPTLSGCSSVLPSLDTCTSDPTAAGCTAVLPSLDTCTATPTAPGCTAVLPTLTDCTTNPALPGCTAVLPTIDTCIATPTAPGCTAVLPTIATCTANPSAPGCTAVLPPLTDCTTNPALPGCTAVLPPLADCISSPSLPGCSAVLPTLATCITDPTLPGCTAVLPLPASVETPVEIVETIQAVVVVDLVVPTQPAQINLAQPPASEQPASSSQTNGASGNTTNEENKERPAEGVSLATASQDLPLAKQPIFDLSGGGIAGQNMVCK